MFPVPKIVVFDVVPDVIPDVIADVALLKTLSAHHPEQSLLSLWTPIVFLYQRY